MKNRFNSLFIVVLLLITGCSKDSSDETPSIPSYTLTVNQSEGGTVNSSGGNYERGTQISISATPNQGYIFTGWSNGSTSNPLNITINSNIEISPNFSLIEFITRYESPPTPFVNNELIGFDSTENCVNNVDNILWVIEDYFWNSQNHGTSNDYIYSTTYVTKDFNLDGFTDIAFSFFTSEHESVPIKLFIFDPSTFSYIDQSDLIDNNTGQEFNRKMVTGDLNNDNIPDLVLVSHPELSHKDDSYFHVVLSNNGRWSQNLISQVSRSNDEGYYHGVALGDVDNDGDLDVVLGMFHNDDGMQTYLNSGQGDFEENFDSVIMSGDNIFQENQSFTNELIDLDQDGCLDLIYWATDTTYVKYGNCNGFFGPGMDSINLSYSMDYKFLNIDNDESKELIILSNDYDSSKLINIYDVNINNENVDYNLIQSIPTGASGYFNIKKIDEEYFLIRESISFQGDIDNNFTDGNPGGYFPLNDVLIVNRDLTYTSTNYPITAPLENIHYDNDSRKLKWTVGYLSNTNQGGIQSSERRLNVSNWIILKSNQNFIETDQNVEVLEYSDSSLTKTKIGGDVYEYEVDFNLKNNQKTYLRISYRDTNGIENHLSYCISIE